ILLVIPPTPVRAAVAERRVVVVLVTQPSIASWRDDPVLSSVLAGGAGAILSTRVGGDGRSAEEHFHAAVATLGDGTRRKPGERGTALGDVLSSSGVPFLASSDVA